MAPVLLAARIVLALVFAVSGAAKLLDPQGTREALIAFGVPERLAGMGARVLPATEIVVAGLLLAASTAWWGSLGALLLLAVFSIAIAANLRRGRAPDCHCFGQLHSAPVSGGTLVRNAALALPALLVLAAGRADPGPSAVAWLADLSPAETGLTAACAGLAVALAVATRSLRRLDARQAELEQAVTALEGLVDPRRAAGTPGPQAPRGLPIGAVAPAAQLTTGDGRHLALGHILREQRTTAVVFVSSTCRPCRELLPKLARWPRDGAAGLRLIVIAPGSREANAKLAAAAPGVDLFFAGDAAVSASFRATWTPAALLLGANGRVASETKFGVADIETLLGSAAAGSSPAVEDSPIGRAVPGFTAEGTGGAVVTSEMLAGATTAVVYWSATCGHCAAMADDLAAWEAGPPEGAPRLVLLVRPAAALPDRFGDAAVIVDRGGEATRAFGFKGTPSAVLVEAGTIASAVCVGSEDVRALLGIARQPGASPGAALRP